MSGKKNPDVTGFLDQALCYDGDDCLFWPFAHRKGYPAFEREGRMLGVHRYICERENGPPPDDKPLALHSCGNGERGCVTKRHLRWGSSADNSVDRALHGRAVRGERSPNAKLTHYLVLEIRTATGSQRAIAARFGVSQATIHYVLNRKRWAHV